MTVSDPTTPQRTVADATAKPSTDAVVLTIGNADHLLSLQAAILLQGRLRRAVDTLATLQIKREADALNKIAAAAGIQPADHQDDNTDATDGAAGPAADYEIGALPAMCTLLVDQLVNDGGRERSMVDLFKAAKLKRREFQDFAEAVGYLVQFNWCHYTASDDPGSLGKPESDHLVRYSWSDEAGTVRTEHIESIQLQLEAWEYLTEIGVTPD